MKFASLGKKATFSGIWGLHNMQKLRIQQLIQRIDDLIGRQLNVILHHRRFQRLESTWRGLHYLAEEVEDLNDKHIKIRMLNVSWAAISKDLERASEFDQSQLFIKIYNAEFGHPGGEPFGLLIGDYYINHRAVNTYSRDVDTLHRLSKVAAAAFAPFITSVDPAIFGLDDFVGLERHLNMERMFQQKEYLSWKTLREDEDTRFVGLVLPRVLLRKPYQENDLCTYPVYFEEETVRRHHYLWGNASYCFAAMTARAFAQTGWFAEIRGVRQDKTEGGLISGLPRQTFYSNTKYATEVCITDKQEKELSDWGFIPLSECKYTEYAAFYDCRSLHRPKRYDRAVANVNAQMSSMLNYILCISRFAHYLKIIARDKVGSFASPSECEQYLQRWIRQYTAAGTDLAPSLKAKYPLRETQVRVLAELGKAGIYRCIMHLKPHGQLDQIEPYLQLTTELRHIA
jgi:type VI secretion system protein ImpD